MCGIAGVLSRAESLDLTRVIERMTSSLAHRGPDDEGYVLIRTRNGERQAAAGGRTVRTIREKLPAVKDLSGSRFDLALGHRRFSIADLSDRGHQPFLDAEGDVSLVYNGFLYNHVELRAELEADGRSLTTTCDTEVVLQSYLRWGAGCFERFNGFWAVAIWNASTRELVLARDRIGKKPLYLVETPTAIFFASEIKALLAAASIERRPNERAVFDYVHANRRDHGVGTFYEDVEILPPGAIVTLDAAGKRSTRTYWRLPEMRDSTWSREEAAGELRALLDDAVRIRLRADVGIGLELSGGLDSSTVGALAAHGLSEPLTAMTAVWEQPEWNEEPFARAVADHLGLDYRAVSPPATSFWSDVDDFVAMQEEPFHNPVLHTQQCIWRKLRESGKKVVLYGAGGDELFAGYRSEYFYRYLGDLARGLELGKLHRNAVGFSELSLVEMASKACRKVFARAVSDKIPFRNVLDARFTKSDFSPGGRSAHEHLYRNMTALTMPYWLNSNDKASMAIPLELRSPLLDHRVIELAFRLPVDMLIHDGWLKWILRKSIEDALPPEVTWRPVKMGYPFPLREWLSGSRALVHGLLASSENEHLNRAFVTRNLDKLIARAPRLAWRVLCLELWHRRMIREEGIRNGAA